MLRRHPTTISLTQEDIATYDDTRDARAARLNHQFWGENVDPAAAAYNNQNGNGNGAGRQGGQGDDPSDELKPLPGATQQGGRGMQGGRSEQDVRREREGRILGAGR